MFPFPPAGSAWRMDGWIDRYMKGKKKGELCSLVMICFSLSVGNMLFE